MPDFPEVLENPLPLTLTTGSLFPEVNGFGNTWASRAWPLANYAHIMPFSIDEQVEVRNMSDITGAGQSGSMDFGVYKFDGSQVVSSGSVTQNATITIINSSFYLNPGRYFFAIACSAAGDHIASQAAPELLEVLGVRGMASAFPLPSTLTFAKPQGYMPSSSLHFTTM